MDTEELAPPPNPKLHNRQPKWIEPVLYGCCGCIVAAIVFVLADSTAPVVIRAPKNACLTEANSNIRQIGFCLVEFESAYGSYPNGTTVALVAKSHPAHGFDLSGTSSNTLFRQFFAVGYTSSEAMFYAQIPAVSKPDGIITDGEALKKGECGFSYITGLSSKDDPLTPILLTPLIPGTTKFDPKPFKGFAVVLYTDNTVRSYKIAKDGHVYDDKGIDVLSPENPIWGGKAPDIRYPEL